MLKTIVYDTACIHCEKSTVFFKAYHSCTVKIMEAIICLKFDHGLYGFFIYLKHCQSDSILLKKYRLYIVY